MRIGFETNRYISLALFVTDHRRSSFLTVTHSSAINIREVAGRRALRFKGFLTAIGARIHTGFTPGQAIGKVARSGTRQRRQSHKGYQNKEYGNKEML